MANFNFAPPAPSLYDQTPATNPFTEINPSTSTQQLTGPYNLQPVSNYYDAQPDQFGAAYNSRPANNNANVDPFGYPIPSTESLPQNYNARGNLPSKREKGEGLRRVLRLGSSVLEKVGGIRNVIGVRSARLNGIPNIPQEVQLENIYNNVSQSFSTAIENPNQFAARPANYIGDAAMESAKNVAGDVGQFTMDRYGLQRDREARFGITVANKRRFAKGIIKAGLNPTGEALALGRGVANIGKTSAIREGRRQAAAARSNVRGMAQNYARNELFVRT